MVNKNLTFGVTRLWQIFSSSLHQICSAVGVTLCDQKVAKVCENLVVCCTSTPLKEKKKNHYSVEGTLYYPYVNFYVHTMCCWGCRKCLVHFVLNPGTDSSTWLARICWWFPHASHKSHDVTSTWLIHNTNGTLPLVHNKYTSTTCRYPVLLAPASITLFT